MTFFVFPVAESARINLELKVSSNSTADVKKLEHEVTMLKKRLNGKVFKILEKYIFYGVNIVLGKFI